MALFAIAPPVPVDGDGKRAQALDAYFGGVSVVAFTPDDLAVVKGGPDGRRAFLDRSVFNVVPAYLDESREYGRALKSRNKLLKDRAPMSHLQAWDATLAKLGARLWVRRRALMESLLERARVAFQRIGRSPLEAQWRYQPSHLGEGLSFATAAAQRLPAAAAAGRRLQRARPGAERVPDGVLS